MDEMARRVATRIRPRRARKDPDPKARIAAAEGLGRFRGFRGDPEILRLAGKRGRYFREAGLEPEQRREQARALVCRLRPSPRRRPRVVRPEQPGPSDLPQGGAGGALGPDLRGRSSTV